MRFMLSRRLDRPRPKHLPVAFRCPLRRRPAFDRAKTRLGADIPSGRSRTVMTLNVIWLPELRCSTARARRVSERKRIDIGFYLRPNEPVL